MHVWRTILRPLALLALLMMAVPAATTRSAQPTALHDTVIVQPGSMQGWVSGLESGTQGSGTFVNGPGTPPAGGGSFQFQLNDNATGVALGASLLASEPLTNLTRLQYSTYRSVPATSSPVAVALSFSIDHDPNDAVTGWQGRLVYEPYHGAPADTVLPNIWQTWNTLNPSGPGRWWRSSPNSVANTTSCIQSSPCTWSQVLAAWPSMRVHPTLPQVVLKAGSGASGFIGNADALIIGVAGLETLYNFEVAPSVTVSPTMVTVREGGESAQYSLGLTAQPSAPVTVTVAVDDGDAHVNGAASIDVNWTPETWNMPKMITVSAIDDLDIEGLESSVISHSVAQGSASEYLNVTMIPTTTVWIKDNDFDSSTVVVRPSDTHGWTAGFASGTIGGWDYVHGPATPPQGSGSFEFVIGDSATGIELGLPISSTMPITASFPLTDNLRLSAITELWYSTYRSQPAEESPIAISFSFNIDHNLTDANTTWQGRLVYEPYHAAPAGTVQANAWQTWYPLQGTGPGRWWRSRPQSDTNTTSCIQSNPCTWDQVLAVWPDMGIHPGFGAMILKAGSGWSNFVGNVDNVTIGVGTERITYDFEIDAAITVAPVMVEVTEDGVTDSYTIGLSAKPTAPVTITATVSNGQILVSSDGVTFATTASVVFTPEDWEARTITVQAVNDTSFEQVQQGTISHTISDASGDEYAALPDPPDVEVMITDNDYGLFLPFVRK